MTYSNCKVTLIVPIYNEAPYLDELFQDILNLSFDTEVIAVDDGSTDSSSEIIRKWQESDSIVCIEHKTNRGKGAAVRSGIQASTGDIVVIQDADLEYDPSDLEYMIKPIQDGRADVVYGSRLNGGRPQRVHMFWHLVGNKLLTLLTNILYNSTLSDMETGYKACKGDVIRSLNLQSNDFRIEPEITAKVLKKNLRVFEVPISYYGRSYSEGKKITWVDAVPAVLTLIKLRITR